MPETDVAMELVQQDVTAQMAGVAGAAVERSRVRGAADDDEDDLAHLLSSELGDVAVPWTWTGVHRGSWATTTTGT